MEDAGGVQMVTWEELKGFVGDVIAMYESMDKEHKTLASIKQLKSDIASLTSSAETDVKRLILEMQSRVSRAEADASAAAPAIEEVRSQLAALEEQKARLVEECQRVKATKDLSSRALHALTAQIGALKQAKATLNAHNGASVPRIKHSLSLYASISSIRWNYDSLAVAGYIAPPRSEPVRPFHLDPRVMSDKAIADALWAAIEEAHSGSGSSGPSSSSGSAPSASSSSGAAGSSSAPYGGSGSSVGAGGAAPGFGSSSNSMGSAAAGSYGAASASYGGYGYGAAGSGSSGGAALGGAGAAAGAAGSAGSAGIGFPSGGYGAPGGYPAAAAPPPYYAGYATGGR